MDDRRLDSLLDEAVADAPPEDVADRVNPWRRSFAFIIWGLVLSTLSFNFYGLNYVLPYAGAALLLLGFRPLRRDNGFFRAAFALCVLRFALSCAALFAGSSLVRLGGLETAYLVLMTASAFLMLVCFWLGVLKAQERAGAPRKAAAGGWLVLWYLLLVGSALAGGGALSALVLLGAFAGILASLRALSKRLDDAGYAISPIPARLGDRGLGLLLLGLGLAIFLVGSLGFGKYRMDWAPAPERGPEAEAVAQELAGLGFPEHVLADMSDADILACTGAETVKAQETQQSDGQRLDTSVIACLSNGGVFVLHHFVWDDGVFLPGTQSARFVSPYADFGWKDAVAEPHGLLLYTDSGENYTAAPIESELLPEEGDSVRIFGWSFPCGAVAARGYFCCVTAEPGYFGAANYSWQCRLFQLPCLSASENARLGLSGSDAFEQCWVNILF